MGFLRYFRPVRLLMKEERRDQKQSGPANMQSPSPGLVKVQTVPEKGRGVIATGLIKRGQRILEEAPGDARRMQPVEDIMVQTHGCRNPTALWDSAASEELDSLASSSAQPPLQGTHNKQLRRACSQPPCAVLPDPDCEDDPNLAAVQGPGAVWGMTAQAGQRKFPLISCINHSCLPNVHVSWNPFQGREVVHAVEDIQPGQEILTTYVPLDIDSATRQQLLARFGFRCACAACCLPEREQQTSDRRRLMMAQLDRYIPALAGTEPRQALACAEGLVKLVSQEGIADTSLKARAYYDAFQICLSNPEVGDARMFAELAFKSYLVCRGADSPATLRLHAYMCNPEAHPASQLHKSAQQYVADVRRGTQGRQRSQPRACRKNTQQPGHPKPAARNPLPPVSEQQPASIEDDTSQALPEPEAPKKLSKGRTLRKALSAGVAMTGKMASLLSRKLSKSEASSDVEEQDEQLLPEGGSSSSLDAPRQPGKSPGEFGVKAGWKWLRRQGQMLS